MVRSLTRFNKSTRLRVYDIIISIIISTTVMRVGIRGWERDGGGVMV